MMDQDRIDRLIRHAVFASARRLSLFAVCMTLAGVSSALPVSDEAVSPAVRQWSAMVRTADPKRDKKCFACHAREKYKSLTSGEQLSLQVSRSVYIKSAHGELGCVGCHKAIAAKKHPSRKTNITIDNKRDFSVALNQVCRDCHARKYRQYEGSIHASLVAQGNGVAPVCTDCHSVHAIETMAVYNPVTGLPCKSCHADIYEAYAGSVHGAARKNGNVIRDVHVQAPICADCHRAHEVTAVASNDHLVSECTTCHEAVAKRHDKWLPNAGLHLEVVACAACHAPLSERRIDLELVNDATPSVPGQADGAGLVRQRLVELGESGEMVDPLELWNLVRQSKKQGQGADLILRGRLEVSSGAEAHRLASSISAVRDCSSCHRAGSAPFQNVTISIKRPDGRDLHYRADKNALNSIESVASISDFYALGGTRISLLDNLLLIALAGGFAIPVGHFAVGRIIRKNKEKGDQSCQR